MTTIALVAATAAALVFIAVGVRALLLQARIARLVDQIQRTLDSDLRQTLGAWRQAAQGVQRTAGKLEDAIVPLNACLCRADRVSERFEPDLLTVSMIQPAIARVSSWLDGVRKGLSGARGGRPKRTPPGGSIETEVG
ncbi:MAG: hypothetical protein ACE149_07210 [Armatimonadota bacterium]